MPNLRVTFEVSFLLCPSEGNESETLDPKVAEEAASEALQNVLNHAQGMGFPHEREAEISMMVGNIKQVGTAHIDMLASKIAEKLEAEGVDAVQLDSAVQDAKGSEASDINNGGLETQVAYLLEGFEGNNDAAEKYIRDQLE